MLYQSKGALHLHTFHSDGTGSVQEVAHAAKKNGLEWIWITDHDTLAGKPDEGFIDGVLTLIGYEITPRNNHYLVGNTETLVSRDLPPAEYIAEVARQGGIGVVAHPDERVTNQYKVPYRWEDWSLRGFAGIELWNYMSDWIEHYRPQGIYLNYFFPSFAVQGPTTQTLRWWDELQVEGARPTGLFGLDAHAIKVHRFGLEWKVLPYDFCFSQLTNYLLLDAPLSREPKRAEQQVWAAIQGGRVIMANQAQGDAAGTTFLAYSPETGQSYTCGDEVPFSEGLTLDFFCPQPANLYLYRDGIQILRTSRHQKLRLACTMPGHYRIEAHRKSLWVMTNHIHVVNNT